MKIAVTGATGYIGTHFLSYATRMGHEILALSRRRPFSGEIEWKQYDLNYSADFQLPDGVDAVIHLAVITDIFKQDVDQIKAAEVLMRASQKIGAKFIFISSQTARFDAPTEYGRIKFQIERRVLDFGGLVIRPGQVYGGLLRGLYGGIVKMVKALPILPKFYPDPLIQPIHIDDLCMGILSAIDKSYLYKRIIFLADPNAITFSNFIHSIARHRLNVSKYFIPLPQIMPLLILKLASPKGYSSLRSLFSLPSMDTASNLEELGLNLRPLEYGLSPLKKRRRRTLLLEAEAIFNYIFKVRQRPIFCRRYIRCMDSLRNGIPLGIPSWLIKLPLFIGLIDCRIGPTPWKTEFQWRLGAATLLSEASVDGAKRFLGSPEAGLRQSLSSIFFGMMSGTLWWFCSALIAPFSRFLFPIKVHQHDDC